MLAPVKHPGWPDRLDHRSEYKMAEYGTCEDIRRWRDSGREALLHASQEQIQTRRRDDFARAKFCYARAAYIFLLVKTS